MNNYVINWFKYERYGEPIGRTSFIRANTPEDALSSFKKVNGGIKKSCITSLIDIKTQKTYDVNKMTEMVS
jgi:hypothetical protein